jgi:hypothetical protein
MRKLVVMALVALSLTITASVALAERDTLPGGGVGVTSIRVNPTQY